MSEEVYTEDLAGPPTETPKAPEKKQFSIRKPMRSIPIKVTTPAHTRAGYEPWGFILKLQLSKEAQNRRQKFLGMTRNERTDAAPRQALDEVTDLLLEDPTGFDEWPEGDASPGVKLTDYYELAQKDDDAKFWMNRILEAVHNSYYNEISPMEFSS